MNIGQQTKAIDIARSFVALVESKFRSEDASACDYCNRRFRYSSDFENPINHAEHCDYAQALIWLDEVAK